MNRMYVAMLAGVLMASGSTFAVPVYSTGFESTGTPSFTAGTLPGQNGWLKQDFGPGAATALVETGVVKTGSQAVSVTKAANTNSLVYVPVAPVTNATTARYVYVSADMQYDRSSATTAVFGPFTGLDIYQGANRIATAGFDTATNDFLFYDSTVNPQFGVPNGLQPIGPGVADPQRWYNFLVSLDFVSKTYHIYVDGVEYTPAAGVAFATPAATTITDADFAVLGADGSINAQAAIATGYFDNYSVSTNAVVPEPASVAILSLGGVAALVRRRRSV